MGYVFVADDFTGASDTLATLARGGYRARLFRDLPSPADLAGIEAWGIATPARALGRQDMAALAARIGAGLRRFAPGFLHLKICSTFDSGPEIGNIALLAQTLADAVGIADIAVLGGSHRWAGMRCSARCLRAARMAASTGSTATRSCPSTRSRPCTRPTLPAIWRCWA